MTEEEWEDRNLSPQILYEQLRGRRRLTRKRRLLMCACCRSLHAPIRSKKKVEKWLDTAEKFADGFASDSDRFILKNAIRSMRQLRPGDGPFLFLLGLATVKDASHRNLSIAIPFTARIFGDNSVLSTNLLRDIFGNPFRPVAFDPNWRTATAVGLAQTMYDARHFNAMPILADALQDAGCEDDAILGHCRDANGIHVRGCWVVDLVLGKS